MTQRKLTDADLAAIRASKESNAALAAKYGVGQSTIQRHRPQRTGHEQRVWMTAKHAYLTRMEHEQTRERAAAARARRESLRERAAQLQASMRAALADELSRPLIAAELLSTRERARIRARIGGQQRWTSLGGMLL